MKCVRRFLTLCLCLLLCLAPSLTARGEDTVCWRVPGVVTARAGAVTAVSFRKISSAPAGEMQVLDEEGNVLTSVHLARGAKDGRILLRPEMGLKNGQILRFCFLHDGVSELQSETMLAIDDGREGIVRVDTAEKKIAITFDSANGVGRVPDLLDLLDRYDAKCTFFLQGAFLLNHPDQAIMISQRGHELANHSMNHADMRVVDDGKILREIQDCSAIIREVTGQTVRYYRPPGGYYTWRDHAIGQALGHEMILWTFDSLDGFPQTGRYAMQNRMMQESRPGAIILMHIYGQYTLQVLETYLPAMREQGYSFVTVGELMTCGPAVEK